MSHPRPHTFDVMATMGPACASPEMISRLIEAGVTSFRFPFAKETPMWQVGQAKEVRRLAQSLHKDVQLIMDLPGSRTRMLNDVPIEFSVGATLVLVLKRCDDLPADMPSLSVSVPGALSGIEENDVIVTGDGELAFSVEQKKPSYLLLRALLAGTLWERRGLTVERGLSVAECISPKDIELMSAAHEWRFDCILLSFVHTSGDVVHARQIIAQSIGSGGRLPSVAVKVETEEAVANIREITECADQIIIGRGDLALQTGAVAFYEAQDAVITAVQAAGKPVHVGTHLLESAGHTWIPYRAELSDLCSLISRGIDGVLLSAETTIGRDPVRVVEFVRELAGHYNPHQRSGRA